MRRFAAFGLLATLGGTRSGIVQAFSAEVDTPMLTLYELNKRVEIYSESHPGHLPSSLEDVLGEGNVPRDAYGGSFVLEVPGPGGMPYDLVSYGSDGVKGETAGCFGVSGQDVRWSDHPPLESRAPQ